MVQPIRSTAILLLPRRPASAPVKAGRRGGRRIIGEAAAWPSGAVLGTPLLLELRRRQVAQRRVNSLDVIDRVEEPAQLAAGIGVVLVFRQVHFLFLDRPPQPLGEAVLLGLAPRGHADA